jgi:mono/diheme cytochrome c family protein
MKKLRLILLAFAAGVVGANADEAKKTTSSGPSLDVGRKLVKIAGCNDCHTSGYLMSEGNIPEKDWLTGDSLGWRGPWGTTYALNLRLLFQAYTEEQWLERTRTMKPRPPMVGYVFKEMTEDELRSIYRFIRSLGPAGVNAPAYVPPDKEPAQPYVQFPSPPPAAAEPKK